MELWTLGASTPTSIAGRAARAEEAGWAGLAVVDSQNLDGDSYVALTVAAGATERLKLATGVTNPVTRHPAVTASAIASVHACSGGRAVLGIGRGDSALAHIGRSPGSVGLLERYLAALQTYLRGDEIAFDQLDFHERLAPPVAELELADTPGSSRLRWLRGEAPKVPVEVASTGPRVMGAAARHADRVMLAVGADPDRLAWGRDTVRNARDDAARPPGDVAIGTYLNIVCHPDVDTARQLVSGGLSTFARFSVMHGDVAGPVTDEQREVLAELHGRYDMTQHTRVGSDQAAAMTPDFIDRYAIVGSPESCVERLDALAADGIDKVMVIGPSAGSDRAEARRAVSLFEAEVLPAFAG